ncbi:MAG: LamG-like jellyroll fold domain-containing protein, partial [Bacteroidota bacterium]
PFIIIDDNEWHYFVAQRKSDSLEVYLDCELIGTSLGSPVDVDNEGPLVMGAQNPFSAELNPIANFFQGSLDEVKIYKRALTLEEILEEKQEEEDDEIADKDIAPLVKYLIYPNPTSIGEVNLKIDSEKNDIGILYFRDQNGVTLKEVGIQIQEGENEFKLSLNGINRGIYFLFIEFIDLPIINETIIVR